MSNNIPSFELKSFARALVGNRIDEQEAKKLGVKDEYKENPELDRDEIIEIALEEDELGELYATMQKAEYDKEVAKDKEKEKEDQKKVSNSNGGAGV